MLPVNSASEFHIILTNTPSLINAPMTLVFGKWWLNAINSGFTIPNFLYFICQNFASILLSLALLNVNSSMPREGSQNPHSFFDNYMTHYYLKGNSNWALVFFSSPEPKAHW